MHILVHICAGADAGPHVPVCSCVSSEPDGVDMDAFQAWRRASPMKAPYDEFAKRWGNEAFCKYVRVLADQADQALKDAPQVESPG